MDFFHCLIDNNQSKLAARHEQLLIVEEVGKGQEPAVVGKPDLLAAVAEGKHFRKRVLFFLGVALFKLRRILQLRVL